MAGFTALSASLRALVRLLLPIQCHARRLYRTPRPAQRHRSGTNRPKPGRPERVDDFQHPALAAIIVGPIDVHIDRDAAADYGRSQRRQCKWVKRFFRCTAERMDKEQVFELVLVLRVRIPPLGLLASPVFRP